MLTRLTHAAIAFAVTVVVYQMYVLVVVPFVEPSLVSAEQRRELTSEERYEAHEAVHKHRELLAAYFPPDHWTLQKPPITLELGKAMFVMDDYQPNDQGQLRVKKCAILFFPRERMVGQAPPRDTIVLEAPHGAVLQMDESVQQAGLSGFGRIQWGRLMGQITVRSDMREPGPQDDLLLTTRDVYLDEDLIRTEAKVDMRLGPHWGRGRTLEIRLVAVERAQSHDSSPSIGGIDSLEIKDEVEAQFSPGNMKLLGDLQQGGASGVNPPVNVTSQGPFRFDFSQQSASFSERVQLKQLHPDGKIDRLLCETLNVYFAKDDRAAGPATQGASRLGFRPGSVEALGSAAAPVVLDSQSQQATARCRRMRIEVDSRRVTLDQGNEVALTYQGSEIRARLIRYQAPPADSSYRVGTLLAAGHGWLRAITPGQKTKTPFEARWTESMQLDRIDGKPVLTLNGRPKLDMLGMGLLWANEMKLYLRERDASHIETDWLPADIVPERLVAHGNIAIESAEISGEVNDLEVKIDYAGAKREVAGNESPVGREGFGPRSGEPRRKYEVEGNQLKMLLTVRDRRPEVTSLDMNGEVVFRETTAGSTTSQPLEVRGNYLHVDHADQPTAEFELQGQPATITAAGMSIHAATLRMNRGKNEARIDSPGELHLPMKKDLSGKLLDGMQFLVVRWQGGMRLENDLITFHGNVIANSNEGSLRTEQLLVTLSDPVRFDGAAQQRETELAQLECREGVIAEFTQRDQGGPTSVQNMRLRSFIANLKTGQLTGVGPGEIESVHLASSTNKMAGFGNVVPAGAPAGQRLRFLRVQFQRDLRGNLHNKHVEVSGDAKAIYGPVASWEQRLDISVRRNPGPETVLISSDRLGIAESPMARLNRSSRFGPIELSAVGNVTIEGSFGDQGTFTARSHTATYDQQKTMFVLQGDGRLPARLTRQEYVGAPFSETAFQKLIYIQATGEIKGEGFAGGKFKQIGTRPQGTSR